MGELSYRPIIEEFTWSYSRIESYFACPYKFFRKYILGEKEEPQFYSSYGSFVHELLEGYYRGNLEKEELKTKFLFDFSSKVQGRRPPGNIVGKYIESGVSYFESFEPLPFNTLDVEKMVNFEVGGFPFVGYMDYLGEKGGELYIVDHKSRNLKPRSKRAKPTASDGELDEMLRQLYLYSKAVKEEYGKFPKALCFNCFREGLLIVEPFKEEAFNAATEWATDAINKILDADSWPPDREYFKCGNLCGLNNECEYFHMGLL